MITEEQRQKRNAARRERYRKNPEKAQAYRLKNKTKINEWFQRYRVEYREEIRKRGRKYYANNKDQARAWNYGSKFGISLEDYDRLFEKQGGKCAICGAVKPDAKHKGVAHFCVDHDHVTGKVRGLLCSSCNTGIGKLQDSPEMLRKAIAYLENQLHSQ